MFGTNFSNDGGSSQPNPEIEQLREETTQTAMNIVEGVQENFISNDNFRLYNDNWETRFNELNNDNKTLMNLVRALCVKLEINEEEVLEPIFQQPYERLETPRPPAEQAPSNHSTQYDKDHDVIMKSRIAYSINQVPEPGFFVGKTSETDLFCQLCEDTFKTYPNRYWPEDAKVNFVKSRLRDAARNWYLSKYKENESPASLKELLEGLKKAFTNVESKKLAKINLVNIRHTYGKINDYIDEFRSYSRQVSWDEEPLVLLFYNGLHPKYKEEINKIEEFPTKLETIITKCILLENSLNTKNKINATSHSKTTKRKSSNHQSNQQYKNYNHYNNHFNYNKNHNYNDVSKVQKINSKN